MRKQFADAADRLRRSRSRRWVREAEDRDDSQVDEAAGGAAVTPVFVRLPMPSRPVPEAIVGQPGAGVSVENQRNGVIVRATLPLDMRAGAESALARVVSVLGAARPHHGYLFANRHSNVLSLHA